MSVARTPSTSQNLETFSLAKPGFPCDRTFLNDHFWSRNYTGCTSTSNQVAESACVADLRVQIHFRMQGRKIIGHFRGVPNSKIRSHIDFLKQNILGINAAVLWLQWIKIAFASAEISKMLFFSHWSYFACEKLKLWWQWTISPSSTKLSFKRSLLRSGLVQARCWLFTWKFKKV